MTSRICGPLLRADGAFVALTLLLLTAPAARGQVAGPNVNMVSGTEWPQGDPFLQRQNEPSIAISSRNPEHLLAGANDYRTVDLPGLGGTAPATADAWLGVFRSQDGGLTWRSSLLPGYPQDNSPDGLASPLKGFHAGADPVLREGTHGLVYYAGLAFDRVERGRGVIFVARFMDRNDTEAGDSFSYLDTRVAATGTAAQFVDKPWLAVDLPRSGAPTCRLSVPRPGSAPLAQDVPAGALYLTYSVFLPDSPAPTRSKLHLARSVDCGATWKTTKLSEGEPLNQGSTIAVDHATGAVTVLWRQIASDAEPHAIYAVHSRDGVDFSKPARVAVIAPFGQGTTSVSARTNSYPSAVVAGGRVYAVWAETGRGLGGDARVVLTSSADGITWQPAREVDPHDGRGHQFSPAVTAAAGRLRVAYYDAREDHTAGRYDPLGGSTFLERRLPVGDLAEGRTDKVFTPHLMDAAPAGAGLLKRRHTVDVRLAEAAVGAAPPFTSVRVSQYRFGSRPGSALVEQLQYNPPNFPMFRKGTAAFIGDYVDLRTAAFRGNGSGFVVDTDASTSHVTWTDNRDVRPPLDGNWANYTPPGSRGGASVFDSTQAAPVCVPGQAGSRNQNVYSSRVTTGLHVALSGNAKPLGAVQRGFVVTVQNTLEEPRTFRLSLPRQPTGGSASFLQFAPLTLVEVTVPRRSVAARTVFVSAGATEAVPVQVDELPAGGGAGEQASVLVNPDPTNPPPLTPPAIDPGQPLPDVLLSEVYDPEIANPDVTNPDVTNPDVTNPDVTNPDVTNIEVANPDVTNPDVTNPDVTHPDVSNPDVTNPDVTNPDVTNGSITDTSWTIGNTGNTSAAYAVGLTSDRPVPSGFKTQLIVHRTYSTPVSQGCDLKLESRNVVLANVPDPQLSAEPALEFDPRDGGPRNVTLALAPGQTARLTLRVVDPDRNDGVEWSAARHVRPAVVAQAANTGAIAPTFAAPVAPAVAAAGEGQLVVVQGRGFDPARSAVVFRQGGASHAGTVVAAASNSDTLFVRLPGGSSGLQPGAASARVLTAGQKTAAATVQVALQPGAPIVRQAYAIARIPAATGGISCGTVLSLGPAGVVQPGQEVALSAFGIDVAPTTVAKFRQWVAGQEVVHYEEVPAACALARPDVGVAAVVPLPVALLPGPVAVSLRTRVNGQWSDLSEPQWLTVVAPPPDQP